MVRVDASARITFTGQHEQVRRAYALGADPDGAAHLRVPHWLPGAWVEREGLSWDAPNRLQVEIVAGSRWVVVARGQAREAELFLRPCCAGSGAAAVAEYSRSGGHRCGRVLCRRRPRHFHGGALLRLANPVLPACCDMPVRLVAHRQGLKNGMMPLGEEVGMVMGQKLERNGILSLAFVLGILVTMAEPAIATLKQAGALVHPDPDCSSDDACTEPKEYCKDYCALDCSLDCTHRYCDEDCEKDWTPGAPFLYATVNLWSDYRLQITIGTGIGMACTVGMLRSLLDLKMKKIIFTLGKRSTAPNDGVHSCIWLDKSVRRVVCALLRPQCRSRWLSPCTFVSWRLSRSVISWVWRGIVVLSRRGL